MKDVAVVLMWEGKELVEASNGGSLICEGCYFQDMGNGCPALQEAWTRAGKPSCFGFDRPDQKNIIFELKNKEK